jgi:thiol-disulfide isomerase/thioredoxin
MKKFVLTICAGLAFSYGCFAQRDYSVFVDSADNNAKMLRGIIQKSDLSSDTSFGWYAESQSIYQHPDTASVNAFRRNRDSIYFIIFMGTWCEDSRYIIPKFFKIQEAANFPENHITVFAVDRYRITTSNLTSAFHITNTPTIIVLKNGKEIGRLVEYGKSGIWDKELTAIIDGRETN